MRSLSRYDLPPGTQLGGRTSQNACITDLPAHLIIKLRFGSMMAGRLSCRPRASARSRPSRLSCGAVLLAFPTRGRRFSSPSRALPARVEGLARCHRPSDSFAPAGLRRSCSRPRPASPTGVASRAGLEFRLGECSSCYSQAARPKRASERLSSLPHGRFFRSRRPTLTQGQVYSQRGSVTSPPHGG